MQDSSSLIAAMKLEKLHYLTAEPGLWKILETQYLQRAADNKHMLHIDFLNLRPTSSQDIMIHVTAIESMATELNDLGLNITEHDNFITTIMCSLPARFGFLSSWDNVPNNE